LEAVDENCELLKQQQELEEAIDLAVRHAPPVPDAVRVARCSLADFAPGTVKPRLKHR
jgi:hypothetical protein